MTVNFQHPSLCLDAANGPFTITYSALSGDGSTPLPNWLSFTPGTRQFSGAPLQIGKYYFQFIAKIDLTSSLPVETHYVSSMFMINAQNDPITFDSQINSASPVVGNLYTLVIDQGTFKDVDSDTIYYIANMKNGDPLPSWAYFMPLTRTFRMQGNVVGPLEFQVRAFDKTD
jgi:hypothetical protein